MIVAMFADESGLAEAVRRCADARVGTVETFTPAPMANDPVASPIPVIVLLAGLVAGAASFWLQTYSSTTGYRFDIGGRPAFAWASFIPTAFENAALIAMAAGFIAFMAINRMPRLYDPVDEAASMRRASRDRWILRIASEDDAVLERARALLLNVGAILVEELPG